MGSCVKEVLCSFSEPYGDYLSPVCEQPNLITDLLKLADNNIPEEYFLDDCPNHHTLIEAEKMLIKVTQDKFRARSGGKERHESEVPEWINETIALSVIDNFTKLNFIFEKAPILQKYPCAALLGSTAPNMEDRLGYLVSLIKNRDLEIGTLYLLTGTRFVDSSKYNDGSAEYIEEVKEKFSVDVVTEKELIQDVYDRICKTDPKCSEIKSILINAIKDEGRANSLDTLIESKDHIKNCEIVLYISTAPFIVYQNEVIAKFAKNHFQHEYETIGKKANMDIDLPKTKIAHYLVMSFAEAVYGARTRITESLDLENKPHKDEL